MGNHGRGMPTRLAYTNIKVHEHTASYASGLVGPRYIWIIELAKTNKCPIPDLFVALVTLPPGGRSLAVPDQPCLPSFGRSAASAGEARLPPGVPSHSATPGRSIQSIVCTYLPAYGHAFRT